MMKPDENMGLSPTIGTVTRCGCCGGPNAHWTYKMATTPAIILFCEKHLEFFKQCAGKVGEVMG